LLALAPGLVACSGIQSGETPADRLYQRGELVAAEEAYREAVRQDPAAPQHARSLFRLGVLYTLADSPVQDEEQAAACLSRLVAQFPDSDYTLPARAMLSQYRQSEDLERRLARGSEVLESTRQSLRQLRGEQETSRAALTQCEAKSLQLMQEAEEQRRRLTALEEDLDRSTRRADRLERELEELKRIDLGSPP
jgi:septal ring factor EnvC (AmiA/AmiB activator)